MKRIAILLLSLALLLTSCRGTGIDGKNIQPEDSEEEIITSSIEETKEQTDTSDEISDHEESTNEEEDFATQTNERTNQLDALMAEEAELIYQMSTDIITCFTEKDKEALKALFCEKVRNQPGFDEEIDEAFEYFQGDIYINAKIDTSASGGESYDDGERTSWDVSPDIPYIDVLYYVESGDDKDTESRYYGMSYYWHIINAEDPSLEGLQYIRIELLNIDSMELGEYIG